VNPVFNPIIIKLVVDNNYYDEVENYSFARRDNSNQLSHNKFCVFDGNIDNVRVSTGGVGAGRYTVNFTPPSGLPADDGFVQLLVSFDDPILPFGCKGAAGTEFIPFATTTGTRTMTIDKAQAAQSGTIAIARQL